MQPGAVSNVTGAGPFIAAVPIMATLAGMGAGAVPGGAAGALAGFGMPEYEAKRFEGYVKEGGILIAVHCEKSQARDRARKLLESFGAQNISSSSEAPAGYTGTR
jgi:hypothetical protein